MELKVSLCFAAPTVTFKNEKPINIDEAKAKRKSVQEVDKKEAGTS